MIENVISHITPQETGMIVGFVLAGIAAGAILVKTFIDSAYAKHK